MRSQGSTSERGAPPPQGPGHPCVPDVGCISNRLGRFFFFLDLNIPLRVFVDRTVQVHAGRAARAAARGAGIGRGGTLGLKVVQLGPRSSNSQKGAMAPF